MTKSTYDLRFLFYNKLFVVIWFQIDNILIFATNAFAIYKKETILTGKIITKALKQLDVTYLIKFNGVKIKLNKNKSIYLNHISYLLVYPIKKKNLLSINAQDVI